MLDLLQTGDAGFILDAFVSHTLVRTPHKPQISFTQSARTHITMPYVLTHLRLFPFLEWDSMVSDILSGRSERMSAKKGSAAARFRPKLITVSANGPQLAPFGRSDTASRLHAETVPSFPLRGRPPTERAGSCTNAELVSCIGYRLHFQCKRFTHTGARPQRNDYLSLHARGSFVSPHCGSLVAVYFPMQEQTHIR